MTNKLQLLQLGFRGVVIRGHRAERSYTIIGLANQVRPLTLRVESLSLKARRLIPVWPEAEGNHSASSQQTYLILVVT